MGPKRNDGGNHRVELGRRDVRAGSAPRTRASRQGDTPDASMAVIEGAFSRPGPFTVRLKFPANYRIPPHWHPVRVTVTVISGSFNMGFGDELDLGKGKILPAGSIFEM